MRIVYMHLTQDGNIPHITVNDSCGILARLVIWTN